MVWLFNTAIPRGQHKKFHQPWSGPYTIVKQLSESTYRIQHTQHRSKRSVVHFDRLKPFNGILQSLTQHIGSDDQSQLSSSTPSTSQHCSEPTLQLLDAGDSDNDEGDNDEDGEQTSSIWYPSRSRHPPRRLTDYIRH